MISVQIQICIPTASRIKVTSCPGGSDCESSKAAVYGEATGNQLCGFVIWIPQEMYAHVSVVHGSTSCSIRVQVAQVIASRSLKLLKRLLTRSYADGFV